MAKKGERKHGNPKACYAVNKQIRPKWATIGCVDCRKGSGKRTGYGRHVEGRGGEEGERGDSHDSSEPILAALLR
jgi:hypothetical protein